MVIKERQVFLSRLLGSPCVDHCGVEVGPLMQFIKGQEREWNR